MRWRRDIAVEKACRRTISQKMEQASEVPIMGCEEWKQDRGYRLRFGL
jgi:hypothetical protein